MALRNGTSAASLVRLGSDLLRVPLVVAGRPRLEAEGGDLNPERFVRLGRENRRPDLVRRRLAVGREDAEAHVRTDALRHTGELQPQVQHSSKYKYQS